MKKITMININLPMHSELYEVGKPLEIYNDDFSKQVITKIIDNSIDDGSNYVHIIEVHTDKGIAKELINTPMTITYGDNS